MHKPLLAATILIAAAVHALTPASSTAAPAGTATAKYNLVTGTVEIDVGAGLKIVGIESMGNIILGRTILPAPQQYDANVIAYFKPTGIDPQVITLTSALKTGLKLREIFLGYTTLGGTEVFGPLFFPEPGTMSLLVVGLMAASSAVRRRGASHRRISGI